MVQLFFNPVQDVLDALLKLSTQKSCGPDMIPPIFIKQCALRLADPFDLFLTYLFLLEYFQQDGSRLM